MLAAIKHGLRNLFNLGGRDARQAFWYYVLFVYIVTVGISMVVILPLMMQAFFIGIQQGIAVSESGDQATAEAVTQGAIMASMADMMSIMVWMSVGIGLLMLVFLAAAFVRRLHDSGLSAYWALLPGGFQAANIALAPSQIDKMMQLAMADPKNPAVAMTMMGSVGTAGLTGWAALVLVIILGVRKSQPGPNRFGESSFTV